MQKKTDVITLTITVTGKKWLVEGAAIHGHSRVKVASAAGRMNPPPRALLDPEVVNTAVRGVITSLETLDPIIWEHWPE